MQAVRLPFVERFLLISPCRCGCTGFAPTQSCPCGEPYSDHHTIFETRAERQAALHSTWNQAEMIAWLSRLRVGPRMALPGATAQGVLP